MNKLVKNQAGMVFIPITAGVLVLGSVGAVAYSRVKHNQLEKQKNISSLKLQESISDSSKKLALAEEQKKQDKPEEVKVPSAAETVKPAPTTAPTKAIAPTTTKPTTTTTKPAPVAPTGSLALQATGGTGVSWTLDGVATAGLKLVWSPSSGPVYPGSSAKYFEGKSGSTSLEVDPGTYYVRICMYYDGKCVNYSNEVTVTKP